MTVMAKNVETGHTAVAAVLPPPPALSMADEMNHRIANNLQLLTTMISAEVRALRDPAAVAALERMRHRIGAIAGVHRHLYREQDAKDVDLGSYLDDLGVDLEASLGHAVGGRRIRVHADAVTVSAQDASTIGILVSELVGNACKYAYSPELPGDVHVELHAMPFGGYRLKVEDRGCGKSTGAAPQGTGLGSRLVVLMASRLGAIHDWQDANPGTRFVLVVGR